MSSPNDYKNRLDKLNSINLKNSKNSVKNQDVSLK